MVRAGIVSKDALSDGGASSQQVSRRGPGCRRMLTRSGVNFKLSARAQPRSDLIARGTPRPRRKRASWNKDTPLPPRNRTSPLRTRRERILAPSKMGKRARGDDVSEDQGSAKRLRPSSIDRLSRLSDELILRVLSHLPVSNLVVCQR